jgi:cytochrome o ubiquinol oxidase subunit IV
MSASTHDRKSYVSGLVLALILTATPFEVVYLQLLPTPATIAVIAVAAIAQMVVHFRYFLHIDFKLTPGENLVALFFTGFLVFVMVGGTLWIMFNLHERMAM